MSICMDLFSTQLFPVCRTEDPKSVFGELPSFLILKNAPATPLWDDHPSKISMLPPKDNISSHGLPIWFVLETRATQAE